MAVVTYDLWDCCCVTGTGTGTVPVPCPDGIDDCDDNYCLTVSGFSSPDCDCFNDDYEMSRQTGDWLGYGSFPALGGSWRAELYCEDNYWIVYWDYHGGPCDATGDDIVATWYGRRPNTTGCPPEGEYPIYNVVGSPPCASPTLTVARGACV